MGRLVDVASWAHLWADRFDGGLEDVFDPQDQVKASVVAAIEPHLRTAEIQRAQRKPADIISLLRLLPRKSYLLSGWTISC
jgi:adenylate cyclase